MKKRLIILVTILAIMTTLLCGCDKKSEIAKHNIQLQADNFNVYRRMTFINLRTSERLYVAEGYFSLQDTADNEIGIIFKIDKNKYKMDYFSVAENVCYVIEQIENTHTNPYYWEIVWYIPLPIIKED